MLVFFSALLSCVALVLFLRQCSHKIGLLDHPGGRKQHASPTPAVGGLAMFIAVILALYWSDNVDENIFLISCAGLLVVLGVLDDRHGLPVKLRMVIQAGVAVVVILAAQGRITHLGALFGGGDIQLGLLAIPFSVIAYVGAINAMNMIDGADGMAGKMAIITTLGVAAISYLSGAGELLPLTWALLGALLGFLMFNTRIFVQRAWVFMGDAGSMWIGLVLAWFTVRISQGAAPVEPAIALWLFGIPLIDTLVVMFRRKKRNCSPFDPDRTHIHHVLEDMGSSVKRTVFVLSLVQVMLVSAGVCFYLTQAPAWVVFWGFVLLLVVYYYRFRNC